MGIGVLGASERFDEQLAAVEVLLKAGHIREAQALLANLRASLPTKNKQR